MYVMTPTPYAKALRNPLKGFTTGGLGEHPFATMAHHYIRWNEIENDEGDGVEKIQAFVDAAWKGLPERNTKVIPRVYLHWSGSNEKYWPADMVTDDYTSAQFQARAVRLVERLGSILNGDPRVAFVELGIFGKWGEHHSPAPTPELQRIVGDAFARAFPDKLVSVRHPWDEFQSQPFGGYWDSFAHNEQMWSQGNRIAQLNEATGRWRKNYVGGEVAYDWGSWQIQPGTTPTDSLADPAHRNFIINTIRWLHCTQLRWIDRYDQDNAEAVAGADLMQQAFGYRFVLERVAFSPELEPGERLRVSLDVKNVGSAPFYYRWPLEVSLLDPTDRRVVWRATFDSADVRAWLPGDGWTEPTWTAADAWYEYTASFPQAGAWKTPPKTHSVSGSFELNVPQGRYVVALAVLDPAGNLPSLRFATGNYYRGGRHPVGIVAIGQGSGGPLPDGTVFDDPTADSTLHYVR
jgi:hypothetical protein